MVLIAKKHRVNLTFHEHCEGFEEDQSTQQTKAKMFLAFQKFSKGMCMIY